MSNSKKIRQIYIHLLGWSSLILLIILQNDLRDWILEDYFLIGSLMITMGTMAYINLYALIPRYLFKKKYWVFIVYCLSLVVAGSVLLTYLENFLFQTNLVSRFVVFIITSVFVLLITSSGKFLFEYHNKVIKLKEIENKQLKDELALLKSQVNPHFLFNTLNNLYGLINQDQNKQAAEIILKLADLMRYLLESSKTDKVSLNKEIQFLEDYLSLEKIRVSKDVDIRLEISGIDRNGLVAPLLFIPLVENVFKHGLQTIATDSFAHFSIALQGNELFFEAKNSVGKTLDEMAKSQTGIENLKKRLQIIYPKKHQLEMERTESFYKVTLHIEL